MTPSATAALAALHPFFSEPVVLMNHEAQQALMARAMSVGPAAADADGGEDAGPLEVEGAIAVIPMIGVLTRYATPFDQFCGLSPSTVRMAQLEAAVTDTNVDTIVVDIDSPGGFVGGTVEFADALAEAGKFKRTIALIRGSCGSGALWIASQCHAVICRPESKVGCIGAYTVLADTSKLFEQLGITFTLVSTGGIKGQGADNKITDALVNDTKRLIEGLGDQFIAAVAKGRGMSPDDVRKLADGKCHYGEEAKQLGLVDAVASTVDAALQASIDGAGTPQGDSMPLFNKKGAAAPQTSAKVASKEDGNDPPKNENVREELQNAIATANAHRDQVRKAIDAKTAMQEDPDDDTKALAKQATSAFKAANDENTRACDVFGDPDDDDDEDDPDDDTKAKVQPAANSQLAANFTAQDYVNAFGDIGAKWFTLDKKPFAVAAKEHIEALNASHKIQVDALKAENESLKAKLGAMERGNPQAAFDARPDKTNGGAATAAAPSRLEHRIGPNLARFAASIKLPNSEN